MLYVKSATFLLVRILGSHPKDPGSSRGGGVLFRISDLSCQDQLLQHQELHQPGIELILQFLDMTLLDASNQNQVHQHRKDYLRHVPFAFYFHRFAFLCNGN